MTIQLTIMPKTYRERLEELEKNESILINASNRAVWANNISALNRDTCKRFTIRTQPATREIRVWRLG
jgi:hypothetical protein